MRFIYYLVFIFCFWIASLNTIAQQRINYAAGWYSLSVKQTIYKKLSYRVMARFRGNNNFYPISSYYVDGGLYYKILNNFGVSLNYVFAPSRMDDGYYRTFHQVYTSVTNRINLNQKWYVNNRIILQHTSHYFLIDGGYKPYSRTDLREKIMINRRITRRDRIYIGDEVMTTLFTENLELRRNRVYVGMNHKFTKQFNVDAFFILQSTFNREINRNIFAYGVTVNYKLNKLINNN